jgi:hypothetical protein
MEGLLSHNAEIGIPHEGDRLPNRGSGFPAATLFCGDYRGWKAAATSRQETIFMPNADFRIT